MTAQNFWDPAKVVIRWRYNNPGLPKKGIKASITQANIAPKRAGKTTANNAPN